MTEDAFVDTRVVLSSGVSFWALVDVKTVVLARLAINSILKIFVS
jgi:hypothetical protein